MWNEGLTFSAVHDCFLTHAGDVDQMNQIIREQFINLYSFPLLEKVAENLKSALENTEVELDNEQLENLNELINNFPKRGDLDLNQLRDSKYFFC